MRKYSIKHTKNTITTPALLATLVLSNVDMPVQHTTEQDTTIFPTLHLSKLLESLKA